MSEEEIKILATDKEVTPEALFALVNEQAYFERIFTSATDECGCPEKGEL